MARCIFTLWIFPLWIATVFWPFGAVAAEAAATVPASSPAAVKAVETAAAPVVGDYWTYDAIDEITGKTRSLTFIVADKTSSAIAVRRVERGKPETNLTYSPAWDVLDNGAWRFKPNDGTGIEPPLVPGRNWSFRDSAVNISRGFVRHRLGSARVVAQENVRTKAGVFSTYKIQASWMARDVHNPTLRFQYEMTTWFAPAIDRWVKRITMMRMDGLLREKTELVLTKWGRGKPVPHDEP